MTHRELIGRLSACVFLDHDSPVLMGNAEGCRLMVRAPRNQRDYSVHVKIYSTPIGAHAESELGWWVYRIRDAGKLAIHIRREKEHIEVSCPSGEEVGESRRPLDWERYDGVLRVHFNLLGNDNGAQLFEDHIFLYHRAEQIERAERLRRALLDDGRLAQHTVRRPFEWPEERVVHLVAHDIFHGDGVGNFVLDVYALFRLNNMKCQMYAVNFDRHLRGPVRHTAEIFSKAAKDDLIFFNFSIYDPYLPEVSRIEARKVLYYHGITPPDLLRDHDPRTAALCERGLAQMQHVREFGTLLANSNWSAEHLREYLRHGGQGWDRTEKETMTVGQCPPVLGLTWEHDAVGRMPGFSSEGKTLLYVGRLAPHKRVDDVIRVFGEFCQRQPQGRLLIVGQSGGDSYSAYLVGVMEELQPKARTKIELLGFVSKERLKVAYRQADAFITMSEHEGFCIPLVKAMYFDLPIFAYAQPAVKETMGGAGVCFDEKDYRAIAQDIDRVLSHDDVKRHIVEKQRQRYKELIRKANGETIWQALRDEIVRDEGAV